MEKLESDLLKNPDLGDVFVKSARKIRLAIKSKNRGKSGGARVIAFNNVIYEISEHRIIMVTIYDKADRGNISDKEVISILKSEGII